MTKGSNKRLGDCLDERALEELALGIYPRERQDAAVQHVARCSQCGPSLHKYLAIFSDEPLVGEEKAILDQLQSSKPEYRDEWLRKHLLNKGSEHVNGRQAAERMSPRPPRPFWWWKGAIGLAAGTAALAVSLVTGPVIVEKVEFHGAQKKLAEAWVECRSTDVRFPGVPYAAACLQPKTQGSASSEPEYKHPSLLEADAVISRNLKKSGDPKWLQLEGRVLLLHATPRSIEEAEGLFKAAQAKGFNRPSLQIDLANAYFEHELDAHPDHPNLQQAIDLLNGVVNDPKLSPTERTVALFNLAIAYEKTKAWDIAVQTWEEYLRQDPSGPWADEARQHRDDAKSKVPAAQPDPGSPESFLQQFFRQDLKPEDPERYQRQALTSWLPHAVEDPRSNAYLASAKLAEELKKKLLIRG